MLHRLIQKNISSFTHNIIRSFYYLIFIWTIDGNSGTTTPEGPHIIFYFSSRFTYIYSFRTSRKSFSSLFHIYTKLRNSIHIRISYMLRGFYLTTLIFIFFFIIYIFLSCFSWRTHDKIIIWLWNIFIRTKIYLIWLKVNHFTTSWIYTSLFFFYWTPSRIIWISGHWGSISNICSISFYFIGCCFSHIFLCYWPTHFLLDFHF